MKTIQLTRGYETIVDDDVYELLNKYKWCLSVAPRTFYALTGIKKQNGTRTTIRMHQLIIRCLPGEVIDHRDGNGLNNLRSNLRICSQAENNRNVRKRRTNTSGYKGVDFHQGKYRARIRTNGKRLYLGYHDNAEDAARAYDEAALKYHGEFAQINFPKQEKV